MFLLPSLFLLPICNLILKFNSHIEEKCKRATNVLNMLRRNLNYASKTAKCKAYHVPVSDLYWSMPRLAGPPHLSNKYYSKIIEMVQHNAERFVTNIYPRNGHDGDFSISKAVQNVNRMSERQKDRSTDRQNDFSA